MKWTMNMKIRISWAVVKNAPPRHLYRPNDMKDAYFRYAGQSHSCRCYDGVGFPTITTARWNTSKARHIASSFQRRHRDGGSSRSISNDSSDVTTTRTVDATDGPIQMNPGTVKVVAVTVAVVTVLGVTVSYMTRQWRKGNIVELIVLDESSWRECHHQEQACHYRSLANVLETMERMGLMGTQRSVKMELATIRQWHTNHGYTGGVVLRDLTRPVFQVRSSSRITDDRNNIEPKGDNQWTMEELWDDPTRLERRECYYLYYEVEPNGRHVQQIFCRGTTLAVDVLTCLQAWMTYDEELQCWLHKGFNNQANRILTDALPLLAPASNERAVIDICGHSLGGAVASIVAAKLTKRGYPVRSLTTVAEPRFLLSNADRAMFQTLLPVDHIRVEHDQDFVPLLPPFGVHAGKYKLWLNGNCEYYVDASQHPWTESVWINALFWEFISVHGKKHRMPSYVAQLQRTIT